jgi:hypothetical protein
VTPRFKPSALSAQRLAGETRSTVRWIGAMLVAGKRPTRQALDLMRHELEWPPLAKTWRDLIVASIAYADIDLLAAELRQQGECRPVEKARDMLAADYGHASGAALGKWLQRTLEQK